MDYFYRTYLMWKTRQRVDPCLRAECESTRQGRSDAGPECIVPTHKHCVTERPTFGSFSLWKYVVSPEPTLEEASPLLSTSKPPTRSHIIQTRVSWKNERDIFSPLMYDECLALYDFMNALPSVFPLSGPLQEGIREGKSSKWLQHAPRHRESSPQTTQIRRHYP